MSELNAPSSSKWPAPVAIAPDLLAEIQAEFSREWLRIVTAAQQGQLTAPKDRRFRSEAWSASPSHSFNAHVYLLSAKVVDQLVDAAQVSDALRNRLRFSAMQWVEAMSPANYFATNPDAQQAMIDSNGESLLKGARNLLQDIQKGRMTQTDESGFELGKNVATTEGAVIYQNRLFQLIQYAPITEKVHQKPLLVVPPCINKFYILDLQASNSFVRHAVAAGFTVMLVSWRNPLETDTDGIDAATWADYLQDGVLEAIKVTSTVTRQKQINALGFCVGGTLLASALALAHAQGNDPVSSLTLLTTLLDFEETGVLDVFVDEAHAQTREKQLGAGGLLSARELGTTFSFLRPAELVWNYVEGNYLKGEIPRAFDLLYWNSDGTNLPGPFFTWYFRNTYLENNLKTPGRVKVGKYPLDLGSLTMPTFIYGSREDHIVPWQSAYASTSLLRGPMRFVLGASGHIAGVINPPASGRRSYWSHGVDYACSEMPAKADVWLQGAQEHVGSWWPEWLEWLAVQSGKQVRARTRLGNTRHEPIEKAPGAFVKTRAV